MEFMARTACVATEKDRPFHDPVTRSGVTSTATSCQTPFLSPRDLIGGPVASPTLGSGPETKAMSPHNSATRSTVFIWGFGGKTSSRSSLGHLPPRLGVLPAYGVEREPGEVMEVLLVREVRRVGDEQPDVARDVALVVAELGAEPVAIGSGVGHEFQEAERHRVDGERVPLVTDDLRLRLADQTRGTRPRAGRSARSGRREAAGQIGLDLPAPAGAVDVGGRPRREQHEAGEQGGHVPPHARPDLVSRLGIPRGVGAEPAPRSSARPCAVG